jgi:peptidoglycan lytic transglycosylase
MKKNQVIPFFIVAAFVFVGCSKQAVRTSSPTPVPQSSPQTRAPGPKSQPAMAKKAERKERPYAVDGKWYFPIPSVEGYKEKGICSWYGPDFHGKSTSSGEMYDMHGPTAAHRTLPYNTQVRVRNLANNKEILVRINDRGPFMKDRILDLSYQSAKELGLIGPGTAWVELEALGILEEYEEDGQKKTLLVQQVDFRRGDFTLQVGAFKDPQNAQRLRERLLTEYAKVEISEINRSGDVFYRVRVNSYNQLEEALRLQKELETKGFNQVMVIAQ